LKLFDAPAQPICPSECVNPNALFSALETSDSKSANWSSSRRASVKSHASISSTVVVAGAVDGPPVARRKSETEGA
jgi:hypothetical protein